MCSGFGLLSWIGVKGSRIGDYRVNVRCRCVWGGSHFKVKSWCFPCVSWKNFMKSGEVLIFWLFSLEQQPVWFTFRFLLWINNIVISFSRPLFFSFHSPKSIPLQMIAGAAGESANDILNTSQWVWICCYRKPWSQGTFKPPSSNWLCAVYVGLSSLKKITWK